MFHVLFRIPLQPYHVQPLQVNNSMYNELYEVIIYCITAKLYTMNYALATVDNS